MPENHIAQLRTKEELLVSLQAIGPLTLELGIQITRNQPLRVARRILSGILASSKASGAAIAEDVAASVLKRPEPSFESYRRELDHRVGAESTDVALPRGVRMRILSEKRNLRGAQYYAERLTRAEQLHSRTNKENSK